MIYTASSAADQTACWITGIVIAALIFLFVKFAAKGSKQTNGAVIPNYGRMCFSNIG